MRIAWWLFHTRRMPTATAAVTGDTRCCSANSPRRWPLGTGRTNSNLQALGSGYLSVGEVKTLSRQRIGTLIAVGGAAL